MDTLRQDLRYGLHTLRTNPGFALVAIVTLALGIGANTAIFSLVNTALLRPVHSARPEELIALFNGDRHGQGISNHTYLDYVDLREGSAGFLAGLAAYTTIPANLVSGQEAQRINVGLVSDNYFRTLGVELLAGRDFRPEEDACVRTDTAPPLVCRLTQVEYVTMLVTL